MQTDELISLLDGLKKNGTGWTACCPAHDDQKQSLSVTEKDGKILLHCFAGCTSEEIVEALGLTMADLFTDTPPRHTREFEKKIDVVYKYTDENGRLLYEVVRYKPKDFRQRRPDGNGGYIYNLGDVRRVPYNLPEVLKARENDETIWIVEGEKDADTLNTLGLTATTFACGASGWRDDYIAYFDDADVVIIPDNDEAGRLFAETVAKALIENAKSVKILSLPNLPNKGDVSDWLAAGGTKDKLLEIAENTPPWEPQEPEETYESEYITKDYAHAAVLAELFKGKYRWVKDAGKFKRSKSGYWIHYENGVWTPISEEILIKDASDTLRQKYALEIAETKDRNEVRELAKKIEESCTAARITGALVFLKGWEGIATDPKDLDKDGYLLNCRNGVINLKTLELLPHSPDYLCTKQVKANYNPAVKSALWEAHLKRFLPNDNIRRQVQRDLGMALIGGSTYQVLPIWWGTGGNGKSTTAKVIQTILGDYAGKAAPDLLAESRFERHPTEIADLYRKRVVFSIEMDKIKRLDEGKTKELTGGDMVKARHMGEDFWEFAPTHTLFLLVNQKPLVTGTDPAIWRRIRLVPWTEKITPQEMRPQDEVVEELLSEADGILTWLVEGLRDWQSNMAWTAPEVVHETELYLTESDPISDFIEAYCELKATARELVNDVYGAYVEWCEQAHEKAISKKAFTGHLANKNVSVYRGTGGQRYYLGIKLCENPNLPPDDDDNIFGEELENCANSECENGIVTHSDAFTRRFPKFEKTPYKIVKLPPSATHANFERENELETADGDPWASEQEPITNITNPATEAESSFPPHPDNCFRCEGNQWRWEPTAAQGNGDWICMSCYYSLSLTKRMYPDKAQKAGFG